MSYFDTNCLDLFIFLIPHDITSELKYKMDLKNNEVKEIIKEAFNDLEIDFIEINNIIL